MKIKFTFFALFICLASFAQNSDKGFSFQGFAIDPDGKALGATSITVKFTISPSTGTGGSYTETHVMTTDPFGVFHATIGKGSKESGSDDFKTLDYTRSGTIYKLKVEVKKTSGGIYTTINEADFNAVPYARKAENGVPVGTIVTFAGPKSKIPEGWALCDGAQKDGSSNDWKQLYEAIGNAWGGSGTTFYLPDLRGMFLRGVNDGRTDGYKDPEANSRAALKSGGNSGDAVGAVQGESFKSHAHSGTTNNDGAHSHSWTSNNQASEDGDGAVAWNNTDGEHYDNSTYTLTGGTHSHSFNTNASGGSETRPTNAGIYYIIKY